MIEFRDIFQTIATIRNRVLTGFDLQHSNKLEFFVVVVMETLVQRNSYFFHLLRIKAKLKCL